MDELQSMDNNNVDESAQLNIGYLVIRFDPINLPRGVVDQDDLSEFQIGLQEIVEGIVRSQLGDAPDVEDRLDLCRFVVLRTVSGSFEIVVTFQQILALAMAALGHTLNDEQTYEEAITAFIVGAAGAAGTVVGTKAAKRATSFAQEQLSRLYSFISAVISARREQTIRYLHDKSKSGLRRISRVCSKLQYKNRPIALIPGAPLEAKIPSLELGDGAAANINQLLNGQQIGVPIQVYGKVTAIDRDQSNFRISVSGYRRRFECRYPNALLQQVQREATLDSFVVVTGTPYFRVSAGGLLPPQYIKVQSVTQMKNDPGWIIQIQDALDGFTPADPPIPLVQPNSLWEGNQAS